MSADFDVCVIGSGAGGGPIALSLAQAGRSVVVLEKGPWLGEADFTKDEIAVSRRSAYTPDRRREPQVVELRDGDGWAAQRTAGTSWDFWNGVLVGGASNLMSGYFHRLKPIDFRLRSEFGPIAGADVVDWPIDYDALEPWYALVEREVGVSGRVAPHPHADRRSTPGFPFPPLAEHPLAGWLDQACAKLGMHSAPVPRAILSAPSAGRTDCAYTGLCGLYGCSTGAKGSSRAALLSRALATGRCEIRARATAVRIASDARGRITGVDYRDASGALRTVDARVYVIACQPVETARLLLLSTGPKHPRGLANRAGQVGQHLLFSTFAGATAQLSRAAFHERGAQLLEPEPWINRSVQDFYLLDEPRGGRSKGGTLDFLFSHPQPIGRAVAAAFDGDEPLWGLALKRRLEERVRDARSLRVEVFADWLPNPDCHVTLDPEVKDAWGVPVARVRIGKHPRNQAVADRLLEKGVAVLEALGGEEIETSSHGGPSTNLVGGTCRFGADPQRSVLDADCRAHEVENLYVTDGSFMPTGGSVPFTWTIYANAFRVAQAIGKAL